MSPAFASPDVAAIIANFEPLSVTDGRPLLVRSRSGNSLMSLQKVLVRFTSLLEKSNSRIRKAELANLLGVESGTERWLYENANAPIRKSRNGTELIPSNEAMRLANDLVRTARSRCVDLEAFADDRDVDLHTLQDLIDRQTDHDLKRFSNGGKEVICDENVADDIKTKLRDAIGAAGSDICDLPEALSGEVPLPVLTELAKDVATEIGGEIRLEGDYAVYVPANYSAAVDDRLRQIWEDRVNQLVRQIEDQGYCVVHIDTSEASLDRTGSVRHDDDLDTAVVDQYIKQHPEESAIEVIIVQAAPKDITKAPAQSSSIKALVAPDVLKEELHSLQAAVAIQTENLWRSDDRASKVKTFFQSLQRDDFTMPNLSELSSLLCQTEYRKDLSAAAQERMNRLEREEHGLFVQLFEARVLIPLHLYTTGIETIKDSTLKQHLEEFVADHFRREVIPQMIKAANQNSLLQDKERERQSGKLRQASADAKTFPALQAAVAKFTKKLKIETPADGMVRRGRYRTMETSAKSMRSMTRGSDVLQNLIWILLAYRTNGLFMSSGKDVSRMIKQYETVGEAETAKNLVQWRDKLKGGQETKEDLQAMRELAKKTVEKVQAERRRSDSVASGSVRSSRRKSSLSTGDTGMRSPVAERVEEEAGGWADV